MQSYEALFWELLQFYLVNYPVLASTGIEIGRCILLVIGDALRKRTLMNSLSFFAKKLFCSEDSLDQVKRFLRFRSSEPLLYDVSSLSQMRSTKESEKIDFLLSVAETGKFDGNYIFCIPVLISSNGIPESIQNRTIAFYFERLEKEENNALSLVLEESQLADLAGVKVLCQDDRPLYAVFHSLAILTSRKTGKDVALYREAYEKRLDTAEYYVDLQGIVELFLDSLERMINEKRLRAICLPKLKENPAESINSTVFFNASFIYMNWNLFQVVCKDFRIAFSEHEIKSALTDAGILITESQKYTCRMTYSINGTSGSIRMMKFSLATLEALMGIDIINSMIGRRTYD